MKPTGRTGWWWIKPQLVQGETKPPCQKKTPKLRRNLSSMIKDFSRGQYVPSKNEQGIRMYQVSKFHHYWSTIDWKFWHKRALNLEHWQNICLDDRFSWKTPFHCTVLTGTMGQSSLGPYFWNCWHLLPWLSGSSQPDLPAKESTGDTEKIQLNDY